MSKVYISGKMTGLTSKQIKNNFSKIEKWLLKNNTDVSIINPAITYNLKKYDEFSYDDWLSIDFAMLDACDIVVLLPNWKDSMGAKREVAHAYKNNKKVLYPRYSEAPRVVYNKTFKFNSEKYNCFEENKNLTKQVALEVEKYDLKKAAENIFNNFIEKIAEENIGQV